MHNGNKDVTSLTVAELFGIEATTEQLSRYSIPMYQRNYAWGEAEVRQLLQDVLDMAREHQKNGNHVRYYIGSLVVHDKGSHQYETIDGQQRHTTLSIILAVLKNRFGFVSDALKGFQPNLAFDNRDKSTQTLAQLFVGDTDNCTQVAMLEAHQVADSFITALSRDECNLFSGYLLNQVIILRVKVPKETDLNHYFEIMNNRGEQLEKHEVLKARLMKPLSLEQKTVFANIWDACADMDRYVQLGFKKDLRANLFGHSWNQPPKSFESVMTAMAAADIQGAKTVSLSLDDILKNPPVMKGSRETREEQGRFSSIINFPNFLLQVLRVKTRQDVPLDDKRLLESFDKFGDITLEFATDFVNTLLQCRMLFDRYILKRENDEDWSLKQLVITDKSFQFTNTDSEPTGTLLMLLSMFHVSFPTQVYKHWLCAALSYLCQDNTQDNTQGDICSNKYLAFLEKLNDQFFFGRYGESEFDYHTLTFLGPVTGSLFNPEHLSKRTNIPNFIFNRLDYLLWRRLTAGEVFEGVDMAYVKDRLKTFSFTFRTSVEHYYPQHPKAGPLMPEALLHSFGNLCLISHSENSRANNDLPVQKKVLFGSKNSESLKLVFMMSYLEWDIDSKNTIKTHEKMMIDILCSSV